MYQLSIIVPIFNVEEFIEDCLLSIVKQITPDVQVICINDGSPDNSINIAKSLVKNYDANIQEQFVFVDQENQGLSAARNTGLDTATGKYIGFLDSDDELDPEYVSTLIKIIRENNYDIVDFNLITSQGAVIKSRNESFNSVFGLMNWYCPARIFKYELINRYRFTLNISYEDVDLTPRLYIEAANTYHIDKTLYWYRTNANGITGSYSHANNIKTVESLETILNSYYQLYIADNDPFHAIMTVQCYFLLCINARRRFKTKKAFSYLHKYYKQLDKINLSDLSISIDFLSKKLLMFNNHPIAYLVVYSLYDSFRDVKDKIRR